WRCASSGERLWPVPGNAATLPVVVQRSIQRIAVEAPRPSTRAASRLLSPSSTSATARALRSFEYPLAIARPRRCSQSNSNLICALLGTPLLFRFTSTENRSRRAPQKKEFLVAKKAKKKAKKTAARRGYTKD